MLRTARLSGIWAIAAAMTFGSLALEAADQPQPQALSNFQQVSDSLCRGAQPSAEGFRELAKMGVHTVLDLRAAGGRSSKEAELVRSLGLQYVSIPLDGFQAPTTDEVAKIFAVFNDQTAGKIFVHCRRGADRTGTVLAMYRIQHDHWTNQQALNEAKSMKMASTEKLMRKFVLDYTPAAPAATATTVAAN
jgi:tyrosine-protein phosphatase SIW14